MVHSVLALLEKAVGWWRSVTFPPAAMVRQAPGICEAAPTVRGNGRHPALRKGVAPPDGRQPRMLSRVLRSMAQSLRPFHGMCLWDRVSCLCGIAGAMRTSPRRATL